MSIISDKSELRKHLRSVYSKLSVNDIAMAEKKIWSSVLNEIQNMTSLQSVHVYAANPEWNEFDTSNVITMLRERYKKISIDQPAISPTASMATKEYDAVIVPCLGFDTEGYRIGRGAGWYDRFLAAQPRALKIGVCLETARCLAVPREAHDQQLDMIVTEQAVYRASHGK